MATKLQVWKQALVHLEKETIANTTDTEVTAVNVFTNAWEGVVEEAFNEGDWNIFKVSAALALNAIVTPSSGWSYVFDYPADYLRTVTVSSSPVFHNAYMDFADEGGYLHANTDTLYIRYISNLKMTAAEEADDLGWPTMFWRYVALKLAFETCGRLTSSSGLRDRLEKQVEKALRKAKSVDARNENNKRLGAGSWMRARGGWAGFGGCITTTIGGEIVPEEGDV